MTLYGFRFDRDAEGVFYVKQRAQDGDMIALPDVAQDRRRFATWQEAKVPAEKWEARANDPRIIPVCNPMYQERRIDGTMAHLELDPHRGTVLVFDTDCKDRAALDAAHKPRHTAGEPTHTPDEIGRSMQYLRALRKYRAGRILPRAAARHKRRYMAHIAPELVREAHSLKHRLYRVYLGAA